MVGFYFFSKTVIGFIGIVGFPQYIHFWLWKNPITTSRMMFQRVNFRLTLLMPQGQNEWLFQYTTSLSSRPAVKLRGQWRKYSVYTSTWNFLAGHAHSCSQNQLQSYVIDGTVSMTCFQIYLLIKNFVTTVYFQVSVSLLAANICLSSGPETRTHTQRTRHVNSIFVYFFVFDFYTAVSVFAEWFYYPLFVPWRPTSQKVVRWSNRGAQAHSHLCKNFWQSLHPKLCSYKRRI